MAIKTKTELLDSIKKLLGENTSDDGIALIEDITDTISDFESKTKDTTDYKAKYEKCDAEWRKKYRDRFFSDEKEDKKDKVGKKDNAEDDGDDDAPDKKNFDELFKKGE